MDESLGDNENMPLLIERSTKFTGGKKLELIKA